MDHDAAIISAIDASPLNRGLDGAAWLASERNVPIVMGDGPGDLDIALFDDEGDSVYQIHLLFTSRGRAAVIALKESLRRIFEDYGAELVFALVPDFRRDVKLISRWVNGKFVGRRETANGPCELFVMSREMWSTQV